MRFGIIKYDNGEIVKVINLDKKLQKEKRVYEILEETENQKELDNLYAKYTGGVIKEKIQKEPLIGSIEYCELYGWKFAGVQDGKGKYLRLLRPGEVADNMFNSYKEYVNWYYESNNNI